MSAILRLQRDLGLRILGAGGHAARVHATAAPRSRRTGNPSWMVTEMALFAPGPSIYGGSDEIQHNIIGERVLGLPERAERRPRQAVPRDPQERLTAPSLMTEVGDGSISAALRAWTARDPDRPAITEIVFDGAQRRERTITRAELERSTNRLARHMREAGVGLDDIVTIGLPNGIAFYETTIAAWKCGATPQPDLVPASSNSASGTSNRN